MKTVIQTPARWSPASRRGFLQVDMLAGMAILAIAIVPLGFSFARERQVLKSEYYYSVANEIVDGETEILLAGTPKKLPDGSRTYPVTAAAAGQLPPGHFQLTKTGRHLRLEWLADEGYGLGTVAREITVP